MKMYRYDVTRYGILVGGFGSLFDYNETQLNNLAKIKTMELELETSRGVKVVKDGYR